MTPLYIHYSYLFPENFRHHFNFMVYNGWVLRAHLKSVDVELHPHGTAPIFKKCILFVYIKLNLFLTIYLSSSDLFP